MHAQARRLLPACRPPTIEAAGVPAKNARREYPTSVAQWLLRGLHDAPLSMLMFIRAAGGCKTEWCAYAPADQILSCARSCKHSVSLYADKSLIHITLLSPTASLSY